MTTSTVAVTSDPDGYVCPCGNRPDTSGFDTVLADGTPIEPVGDGAWDGLYGCRDCGQQLCIIDPPQVVPGLVFTHDRHLDTSWKPGPGQRYVDAPKVQMRVSRVTATTVYFTHLDGKGRACLDRAEFTRRFVR